jgi:hypothetical protein
MMLLLFLRPSLLLLLLPSLLLVAVCVDEPVSLTSQVQCIVACVVAMPTTVHSLSITCFVASYRVGTKRTYRPLSSMQQQWRRSYSVEQLTK